MSNCTIGRTYCLRKIQTHKKSILAVTENFCIEMFVDPLRCAVSMANISVNKIPGKNLGLIRVVDAQSLRITAI